MAVGQIIMSPIAPTGNILDASYIDTNTSLGTSDTKIPSQKAVKTYVDTNLKKTQSFYQFDTGVTLIISV